MKIATSPLKKVTPSFPRTPSKSWGPLVGGSTPTPLPPCRKGGCTLCGSWDIRHSRQSFLSFWATFWPLTPLKTWNIQILKKWKNCLEISFYTCLPQMSIIWCTVPEIWNTTDRIFSHFGQFLTLLPL